MSMIFYKLAVAIFPILSLWACDPVRPSSVVSSFESREAYVQSIEPTHISSEEAVDSCNVVVSFTSVCCGVNKPLETRINDLVASDVRVISSSAHPWGREGEVDLCVRTKNTADAGSLTRDIEAIIASDRRAPLVVVRQGGRPQAGDTPHRDLSTEQRVPGT